MRIESISAAHFRGISRGSLTFTDQSGIARSALLLGDNGSGKSSFLEALNFALTGYPPQLVEPGRRRRVDPRNLIAVEADQTSAEAKLDDGRSLRSTLTHTNDGNEFRRVAVMIKRDHLLAFSRATDDQRGGFLRSIVETKYLPKDEPGEDEAPLRQAKKEARIAFDDAYAELSRSLRLTARDKPNLEVRSAEIFRTANRITKKQVRLGRARKLGDQIDRLVALGDSLQQAALDHESASNALISVRRVRQRRRVIDVLVRASDRLNAAFQKLAHQDTRRVVSKIEITQVGGGHVALSVVLPDGSRVPASSVLSEASLDLAALLAIVSLIQDGVHRGQPPILILDDVFHSVDSLLRDKLAAHFFTEFSDWQLIMAFHDRVWFERFVDIAKETGFPHVRRRVWRGMDGEIRVADGYRGSRDHLEEVLQDGEFSLVPTVAARVLEELAESLSMSLKVRVTRSEADKYTLGDLLPGIRERLGQFSIVSGLLDRLDAAKHLRNLVGAHSTSWAEGFPDAEAEEFGRTVLDLYAAAVCPSCQSPLRLKKEGIACRCGQLSAV
ncbi:AAA family ATPase [Kribbella sandramycini]|uniref:AAA family ATPase n=1 Tax=Kribbella sandramycini TaxID=60450 RepID=A0A7Y4KXZ5_9ACTN|nr:recombinational DNA repair ATPase RecF [Kribbella sandramycini]NOL40719.1 AAA family ATPase [Kribbella sandramycini]